MRLLVDMNMSPRWVEVLAEAGFEAIHWSTIGPPGATDDIVMRYAVERHFVVLTHDLDFGAMLAASGRQVPSVVQVRAANLSAAAIAPQVIAGLKQMRAEIEAGALLSIDVERVRLRLLPLASSPTQAGTGADDGNSIDP